MNIIRDIHTPNVAAAQISHQELGDLATEANKGFGIYCSVINTQQSGFHPNKLTVHVTSAKSDDVEQQFLNKLNSLLSAKGFVCKETTKAHHYECKPISG